MVVLIIPQCGKFERKIMVTCVTCEELQSSIKIDRFSHICCTWNLFFRGYGCVSTATTEVRGRWLSPWLEFRDFPQSPSSLICVLRCSNQLLKYLRKNSHKYVQKALYSKACSDTCLRDFFHSWCWSGSDQTTSVSTSRTSWILVETLNNMVGDKLNMSLIYCILLLHEEANQLLLMHLFIWFWCFNMEQTPSVNRVASSVSISWLYIVLFAEWMASKRSPFLNPSKLKRVWTIQVDSAK